MNILKAALLLGALAVSSLTPAFAQSPAMRVNVPFSFYVGTEKFAAGEYELQTVTDNGVIYIQGTGHGAAVLTSPFSAANPDTKASLVFENVETGARLVRIQMEGEPSRAVSYHHNVGSVKLTASR